MRSLRIIGVVSLLTAACAVNAAGARLTVRATQNHSLILSVDPALHQRFGLAIPVTYIIPYGGGYNGHQVSIRYDSTSGWTPLAEKDEDDHFNGIDAVRFDEVTRTAYVSVAFAAWSDDIHIRIRSTDGASIPISFDGVARYYDNRDAAVVVSIDDWKDYTDALFVQMAGILRSYRLAYTTAVITGETTDSTWAHIQAELDAGGAEAASHTRSHPRWPYADVENQVAGSRLDLLEHLTMPPQYRRGETEYVYSFLVPFGETSAEIESTVTHAGYLNCRVVGSQNGDYAPWDTLMARFRYDGTTKEMGAPWGSTDAGELNGAFDQRLTSGGIYHLLLHPNTLIPSGEINSEFFSDHLSHISDRDNVWYTTFGHLYVYRLIGDSTAGQTVWPLATPTITLDPSPQIVDEGASATFSCAAAGTTPLTFQWQRDGNDVAGATTSSLILTGVTRADSGAWFRCVVRNEIGADTSAAAMLRVITAGSGSVFVSDDFNAVELDTSVWQVIDPLQDVTIGVTGGGTNDARLVFSLPAGTPHDLWSGDFTAPRVMQPAVDGDMSVEVKFDGAMTASIQTQGLLFEEDSLNFIRFDLVIDASEVSFFAATFVDGTPTEHVSLVVPLHAPYRIRVRRIGDLWSGMFSADGTTWTTATTFTHHLHVRRIGPWAGNAGTSAPSFTAAVDYVANTSSPIIGEDGTDIRTAPSITGEPGSLTRFEGDSASFSIGATGASPLAYRWQRNGADITGAVSGTLSLSGLARADSGASFRCIVSNGLGRDTSAAALLHVIPLYPAAITREPEDTTVYAGTPAGFRVAASGTQPISFRWQRNGHDIPEATDSLLTFAVTSRTDSGAGFRCIVTNQGGSDTSATAVLHVIALPTPVAFVRLTVRVFLEGAMSGDSMRTDLRDNGLLPHTQPFGSLDLLEDATDTLPSVPPAAVDWILVELREALSDSTVRARRAGLLLRDGTVAGTDGTSPLRFNGMPAGNYYIVVRHRNHLTSMSALAVALDTVAFEYDFRGAAMQSYGGDAVLLSCGKFGMIGGSVDRDRGIGATDLARVRQAMTSGPGYLDADCNMDGTVTATDLALPRGNIGRLAGIR